MEILNEEFIKQACTIRKSSIPLSDIFLYKRLLLMSDKKIQQIMSEPTEEAQRFSGVLVPTLGARNVGKEMTDEEIEFLLERTNSQNELNEYLRYFKLSKEYGDHLISILPDCPITKKEAIMDRLLILANRQNEALFNIAKPGHSTDLFRPDTRLRNEIYRKYLDILGVRKKIEHVMNDSNVISMISSLAERQPSINKETLINFFISHYTQRRFVLSNINSQIMADHGNCINHGPEMQKFGIDISQYMDATIEFKNAISEHKSVSEEARKYYKSI